MLSTPHIFAFFIFSLASPIRFTAPHSEPSAYSFSIPIHPFMSALLFMPTCSDYEAPTFDRSTPRELLKFFIISSMQVLKPIFNDDIAITWSSPRIFALGCLFTSKVSPHPHKLDKGLANQDTHILASSSAFAALAVSDRPSAHIGN